MALVRLLKRAKKLSKLSVSFLLEQMLLQYYESSARKFRTLFAILNRLCLFVLGCGWRNKDEQGVYFY